mgnify:CR=1 FL=1
MHDLGDGARAPSSHQGRGDAGAELVGEDFMGLVHPDDVERHRATFLDAARRGGDYRTCYRIVRPRDGRVAWIEERGSTVTDPETGAARVCGVHWDITERVRAERALQESEERFRALAETGALAVWRSDAAGGMLEGRGWDAMTGQTKAEIHGDGWLAAVHPDDRAATEGEAGRLAKGLVTLRVDPVSGRAAAPGTPDAYFELFKSEDSPPPMSEFEPGMGIPGSPLPADEMAPIDLF